MKTMLRGRVLVAHCTDINFLESCVMGIEQITESAAVQGMLQDPGHPIGYLVQLSKEFITDSVRLVRRCTKPDAKEFHSMMRACTFGMLMMGLIGFIVKLIFIPINNIIVGSG
eukprot:Blabericola_migrator_1__1101@NODE_1280_length_4906_cov_154_631535_g498_i1_p4_GENE_NODE_1280_length_4906_cov_154_631535_g498_i1NODE_1280_length_4906_cov_154_631535_g498_i1_p4_ORF_typecomplete_len113_score13_69SecE/PF00584_20/1e16Hol_Tox/PF16935_5/0_2_NODE_1280_length_4906_cov_154_631535_g498_i137314069